MRPLREILECYKATIDSQRITAQFLLKSTKGEPFRGTVFLNKRLDDVQEILLIAQRELGDLFIVSLVASFEERLASHLGKEFATLHAAVAQLQAHVSPAIFEDVQRLCQYRDWVSHGKRWTQPAYAEPEFAYTRLSDFLKSSGVA